MICVMLMRTLEHVVEGRYDFNTAQVFESSPGSSARSEPGLPSVARTKVSRDVHPENRP